MQEINRGFVLVCGVLAGVVCNTAAQATGYFINQQSVPGLGRANAGNVAAAYDPSTIFFNPAGLTEIWQYSDPEHSFIVSSGTSLIVPRGNLLDRGSTAATPGTLGVPVFSGGPNATDPTDPTPVPHLYVAYKMPETPLSFGVGITSPFGLAAEYNDSWFGRYDSTKVELQTINVSPVVAIKLSDQFSIGGGIDFQYAASKLVSALPNPLAIGGPSAATDGRFESQGDDFSIGYNVGVLYKTAGNRLTIGAHFRSEIDHSIEGTAKTSGLTGPLASANGSVGASAELDLPARASIGAAYEVIDDRLTLLADVTWYHWSDAKEARIKFADGSADAVRPANFRDALSFAIGAEYRFSDDLTVRGGFRYDQTPTVDETRDTTFPDSDRFWLAVGATYNVKKRLKIDLAYTHVFVPNTSFDVTRTFYDGTPLESTTRITGSTEGAVDTFALGFRYEF